MLINMNKWWKDAIKFWTGKAKNAKTK